jgi:excisionase family DNA binding protein
MTTTTPIPEGTALFTPRETQAYIRVSATTLRKLAALGALRPIRIGRALRYRRSDVEAYIQKLATAGV